MKSHEFKDIIRQLVKEEVKNEVQKQLPKLLFEILDLKNKSVVKENISSDPIQHPFHEQVYNKPTPQSNTQNRPLKKFTKDPILNQILNETTPGLPQTPYGGNGVSVVPESAFNKVGVSDDFMGEMRQIMNENTDHMEQPQSTSTGNDISRLFNKNFSAILKKSKEKTGGNMSGIIQSS